ncbi:DDE-type integrase/transposase/recombinase [Tolypothrix sp. FACHB-123]|nr:DDE-type integrase/transposase/recombinase [Tolypothrix sp. FACHB-123]
MFIPTLLDRAVPVDALVDTGCDCYCAVSESLAQRLRLSTTRLPRPRILSTSAGVLEGSRIRSYANFHMDIDGWGMEMKGYVIPGLAFDFVLGLPWMAHREVLPDATRRRLIVRSVPGLEVPATELRRDVPDVLPVWGPKGAATVARLMSQKGGSAEACVTSIREMTALLEPTPQQGTDGSDLPHELREFADLFSEEDADALPPHRGTLDHHVRLRKDPDGKEPELPWGPLYNMPRDQLIELRRQVTKLMDRGWIRASSSSAAAPVLLVKKAGGGWRFCCDYRALNRLAEQDRYPLPLIKETLRSLSGATWFTKLDVRAAFHRLRMARGHEKYTAFRTRFGLFEWLVCPFGLSGAPATFQRYINGALGESLGDFTTAYLDDVLIYTTGSKEDHWSRVKVVMRKLRDAGLFLDIGKCAFAEKEVKYLGYIVRAGHSVRPDPEKIRAVEEWEAPRSVRDLRSFLGFANFYRDFIPGFSSITEPLNQLTTKGATFRWEAEEEEAFQRLKLGFVSWPVLRQWDPDLETLVEPDSSGRAIGGCLSQRVGDAWHPVAYHSAKLSPAQRNYTIHDKELLAVISCLKAWSAELRSVAAPFTILTDHKNLEYFTHPRLLSERQARWAETLSLFHYHLRWRPGPLAARPDALSRRPQDRQDDTQLPTSLMHPVTVGKTSIPQGEVLFETETLQGLWDRALERDDSYSAKVAAVRAGARLFPPEANSRLQVADCGFNAQGSLTWRGVLWVPKWEPLTTALIQRVHDSPLSGHPGRNTTFKLLRRDFHWEGMSVDVGRFVRNCHCFGAHASRRKRQGLLQPLPIPDRAWTQISLDFMTDLPAAKPGDPRHLLVITDRLTKYVQLEAMESMGAEACAMRFRDCWWRFHGFPRAIVTDRGSDWLGRFWSSLCRVVGIEQMLSTAHHPQTDGGTERMNQEVQAVLRMWVSFEQTNWAEYLAACQLALNNRESSVTGLSPNKILNGFEVDMVQLKHVDEPSAWSEKGRAVQWITHLQEGIDLAQAAIAWAQQRTQETTDASRRPAEQFRVGDMVWLSMRHVKTDRSSKKLDWRFAKYKVIAVPTPLTVTLDIPGDIHKTFHVDLLERAGNDPLPSQMIQDSRPGPVLAPIDGIEGEGEFAIEEILAAKNARGRGRKRQVLVRWEGYSTPTWEPLENVEDTAALASFESKYGDARTHDGPTVWRRGHAKARGEQSDIEGERRVRIGYMGRYLRNLSCLSMSAGGARVA